MRVDVYLTEHAMTPSRAKAREMILDGCVTVNGKTAEKPSLSVSEGDVVLVAENPLTRYVGRGGLKLEAALDAFGIDPCDTVAVDIGASSGGFTDCLLKRGARFVYAVDSGEGQLHPSLATDTRVENREKCNARYLSEKDFPLRPTLAVMDVSFISQTLIHPAVADILPTGGVYISLVKPQFEVGRAHLGKGGIVRDPKAREAALEKVIASARMCGLSLCGQITSPITGGDGNTEYLVCFRKTETEGEKDET